MSAQKREQNSIAFLRRENDGRFEELMAEIDERRRWMNRFDLWLFLSVWVVITTVAGVGLVLHN
jgi:hypothetical protein